MARGWFFCSLVTVPGGQAGKPLLRDAVTNGYQDLITSDGGRLRNHVLPRGRALVAVAGVSASTLATIGLDAAISRVPAQQLDDPLSSLTANQKNAIRAELNGMGYTNPEINARLTTDMGSKTLADLLRFACSRSTPYRADPIVPLAVLFDGGDVVQPNPDGALEALDRG